MNIEQVQASPIASRRASILSARCFLFQVGYTQSQRSKFVVLPHNAVARRRLPRPYCSAHIT